MRLLRLTLALAAACGTSHVPSAEDGGRLDAARARDAGRTDAPTGIDGPPIPDCETFSETDCAGAPYCVPHYDDECCPSCEPGGCADCIRWRFHACGTRAVLCSPAADPCGRPLCEPPDCASARPVGEQSCDIPGCVPAVPTDCHGCAPSCRAVTPVSCVATCEIVEPPCPPGTRAEGDGGCYTGFCIPAFVCG